MTPVARTFVWVAAVTLVAIAATWFVATRRGEAPPVDTASRVVPLATVREGYVERRIVASGRVGTEAGTQTKLAFSIPGTIRSVDVRLGDRVDTGTALARIDETPYSLAAQQAGAEAQAAVANAAVAAVDRTSVKLRVDQAELRRQQRLYDAGIVARRDVESAQAAVAADRAESQSAHDQLHAAQASSRSAGAHAAAAEFDVTRTVLRAPTPGVVTGIFVQPGETVDAATPAIALAPASIALATLDVPVNDVLQIHPGDVVHAQANGRRFDARVAGIGSAVNSATGLATVSVTGVPADVPSGTPVDAGIVVGKLRGLVVPHTAIVVDPQNGNTLVFVQTRDRSGTERFSSRVVTIDAQNDAYARVASGLRAGDRVAAQGGIDLLAPSGSQ